MPRFSANLSMMFTEVDFLDRFAVARAQGFKAVEFLFPYDYKIADLAGRLKDNNLELVLFNSSPGAWEKGERGIAALPDRQDEFRRSFDATLRYAQGLSCRQIHIMAGLVPAGEEKACRKCFIANLNWAAELASNHGVRLLVEPLNARDVPNYLVGGADMAVEILAETNRANVFLQFDVYHIQMSRGFLTETLRAHFDQIRHVQIAGVPGRHEPDENQEINFPYLFDVLEKLEYAGWIGCEYRPRSTTAKGLKWANAWGIGQGER